MPIQTTPEEFYVSLLLELSHPGYHVTLAYFLQLIQDTLGVDRSIAEKVYYAELKPHVLTLAKSNLVLQIKNDATGGDDWFYELRLLSRGKEYLKEKSARKLREIIASDFESYSLQTHFLDVLEEPDEVIDTGEFDPATVTDERERVTASIVRRRGQDIFREGLLAAYEQRCPVTQCDVVDALEAAHITPYKGVATQHLSNGLLLRADLHILFDMGLMTIEPTSLQVRFAAQLQNTAYAKYHGIRLREPLAHMIRISTKALLTHYQWATTKYPYQ